MKKIHINKIVIFLIFLLPVVALLLVLPILKKKYEETIAFKVANIDVVDEIGEITEIEKPENYQIIVIGDNGTGDTNQYAVAKSIQNYCKEKDCSEAYVTGDIIYNSGVKNKYDDQFRTKFEEPYRNLDFPFYISYGNHDYLGCTTCYLEYKSPNDKWKMPSAYYTVRSSKNVEFFVIDTENYTTNQDKWLKTSLIDSKALWKIIIGHKPLVTYEEAHVGENWNNKELLKQTICQNADIYIAGHSHIFEYNGKVTGCIVEQLVVGTGGRTVRNSSKNSRAITVFSGYGFLSISPKDRNLETTFIDIENKTRFSHSFRK